jgi:hypothetical protein
MTRRWINTSVKPKLSQQGGKFGHDGSHRDVSEVRRCQNPCENGCRGEGDAYPHAHAEELEARASENPAAQVVGLESERLPD